MLEYAGEVPPIIPPGLVGSSGNPSAHSIKWDSSQFTNFKEVKQWDNWCRNNLYTARAQGADDVLDPKCASLTLDDMSLFREKNKFMSYLIATALQTDQGKNFF